MLELHLTFWTDNIESLSYFRVNFNKIFSTVFADSLILGFCAPVKSVG